MCEELGVKMRNKLLNDSAKRVTAAELLVHKRRANLFYNQLKESEKITQNDPKIVVLSFDFMQNMGCQVFQYRIRTTSIS